MKVGLVYAGPTFREEVMTDKWYYKEVHLKRDPPLPKGWHLTGHPSCDRDVAVKFCPHWHKRGQENAKTRDEVIQDALSPEEIRVNAPSVIATHRAMTNAKREAIAPKKRNHSKNDGLSRKPLDKGKAGK